MKKKFLALICALCSFALIIFTAPALSSAKAGNIEPVGPTHESLESCINQAQDDDIFLLPKRLEMKKTLRLTRTVTFQPDTDNGVTKSELVFARPYDSADAEQENYRHFVIANTGITVTFSGITFSAKGFGGGITDMAVHSPGAVKATVVFNDCTFTNCEGKDGGALLAYDTVNYQFNNCTFTSNKANRGGAVAVKNGGEPLFNGCTFIGNEADDYGSAVVVINNYLSYAREVKIIDSVFKRNLVHSKNGSLAGALACVELNQNIPANETYSKSLGKVFVDNCVFEENIAVIGGLRYPIGSAVSTENMEITLKNTTFKNNANAGSGTIGVMFPTAEPKFNVENVTVENNYVQVSGGSIYFYSTSFFEFKPINSTFGKNYSANGNEIVSLGTLGNGNPTVVLTPVGNSVVHEKGYLTSQYPKTTLNPLPSIIAVVLVLGLSVVGVYLLYRINPKNILGKVENATKVEEETAQE